MSPLYLAVLTFAAPPSEGVEQPAAPPATVSVEKAAPAEKAEVSLRTGPELREAVRAALRRWARPSDAQANAAAREFLGLYKELQADDQLSRSQREYFVQKVRLRLMRLSDQITVRIARQKRLAKSRQAKADNDVGNPGATSCTGKDYVPEPGASNAAFGGGAFGIPDYGPQLVELIQTTIRPDTWDINGGPGSIYYWRPGRALVIRQMGEVHDDIGGVLGQLRRAGQ